MHLEEVLTNLLIKNVQKYYFITVEHLDQITLYSLHQTFSTI